jgi:hypothetical protein
MGCSVSKCRGLPKLQDSKRKTYEKPTLVKAGTLTIATGVPKEYSDPI